MKRKSSLYIKDLLEAMEKIEEFTQGMSFEDFIQDDKTSSAVVRKLEIIGEAVKQLPKEVRDRFEEIPWSSLAKTRDKIIHFYHGMDYEIIWRIIKEELPLLKSSFEKIHIKLLQEKRNKRFRSTSLRQYALLLSFRLIPCSA
ncbi:MAG TPA: DUF86 domain-containing protein [Thermotogaceae bacterium]|nr:DUF86 domain-containing protein [Thermotogaceae bacterium]